MVCLASGPSLTVADCEKVMASGHPTIVTNTTFRMAPWADVLFGMDLAWWKEHHKETVSFGGRKLSTSHAARAYGAESLWQVKWFPQVLNSGVGAIALAMAGKPERVVLLGYDCQDTGGKTHWHPDHPKPCGNAASMKRWPRYFERIAKAAREADLEVVNATRSTALTCFPCVALEDAL